MKKTTKAKTNKNVSKKTAKSSSLKKTKKVTKKAVTKKKSTPKKVTKQKVTKKTNTNKKPKVTKTVSKNSNTIKKVELKNNLSALDDALNNKKKSIIDLEKIKSYDNFNKSTKTKNSTNDLSDKISSSLKEMEKKFASSKDDGKQYTSKFINDIKNKTKNLDKNISGFFKKITKSIKSINIRKDVKKSITYATNKCKDCYARAVEAIKKNKILSISVAINTVLVIMIGVLGVMFVNGDLMLTSVAIGTNEKETIRKLPKVADPSFKQAYQENYDKAYVKGDFVGQIIFESGIINEPVLQGDTNETYLRRNFETYKYEVCGPVFMDYICDKDIDQNLILYGHNRSTSVDPEHIMMFTPLHVLEKQENYEANKVIYLALEDRVDVYLVASVYPVKVVEKEDGNQYLVKGEPKYYLNNYNVEDFKTYYEGVKQKQLYETGVKLVNTDKLLTLQTCYEGKVDKLIILAKKISSIPY